MGIVVSVCVCVGVGGWVGVCMTVGRRGWGCPICEMGEREDLYSLPL
jgi:hypothetical protein